MEDTYSFPAATNKKRKSHLGLSGIIIYIFLVISCILVLFPILWALLASFSVGNNFFFKDITQLKFTLDHYRQMFSETNFVRSFLNTMIVASLNMVASVVLTVGAAFVFSRYRFKGRRATLMTILVLQMFPNYLAMVAIYVFLTRINLLDSLFGLVIIYISYQVPFNTWLVKGYLDGITKSFDEAAKIDGATNFTIFTRVILPLSTPIITYVALTNFLQPCMDFILPQIVLRTPGNYTIAVMLYNYVGDPNTVQYTTFAAGAIIVSIPAIILFNFLQKYIVQGMSAGAVKI